MKKSKLIFSICMLVAMAMSLAAVSYSWLRRDWRPTFKEDNIQIQTGSTLSIRLVNGENKAIVTLNDLIGSPEDFRLKQVSNLTGRSDDFFNLEFKNGLKLENSVVQHISTTDTTFANNTARGEHYGYIEATFFLVGNTSETSNNQSVYVDPSSYIDIPDEVKARGDENEIAIYEQMLECIRVSITVHGVGTGAGSDGTTYGIKLSESTHTGINNLKKSDGEYAVVGASPAQGTVNYADNGQSLTALVVESAVGDNAFKTLDYYKGALVNKTFDDSKALFTMSSTEIRRITIRVWLEGTAPGCTNEISGLDFNIAIVLAGYDISNASANAEVES